MRRLLLLGSMALALAFGGNEVPSAATRPTPPMPASNNTGLSRALAAGCSTRARAHGHDLVLPVRIVPVHQGAVAVASVCIDGAGPFPFLVDSGSSYSVVDTHLSTRFHLPAVASPAQAAGIACKTTVQPERVSTWSVAGLGLSPQEVLGATVPSLDDGQPLAGLIGSDVLSRFGAVRIDYRTQTLSLGNPETSFPTAETGPERAPATPTPPSLVKRVRARVGLRVVVQHGAVAPYASITLGRSKPQPFVVDTGAAISAVSSVLAGALHLAARGQEIALAGFGCPVTAAEVDSGPWRMGSVSLPHQMIARLPSGGADVDGLLGSDVFVRYGAIAIDYRNARMLLETG